MEVKVGVKGSPRDLVLDTDASADEVQAAVAAALAVPGGILTLDDVRGRRILVPADKLGYVEIGEAEARKVGFGVS